MATPEVPTKADPEILIIMTGGTICMQNSPNGFVPARNFLETCLEPEPSFNDHSQEQEKLAVVNDAHTKTLLKSLRTPISAYKKRVHYTVFEFEVLLDSSSIDSKGWAQIAEAVWFNYRLFDGFVILHGTDSLAYTSSALSFMLKNLGKPVILTGSQLPMRELQSDAGENLLGALIIAGHFMIPEVCLFFHHKLFRGNRSTKVSASDFDAFASPNYPALASISSVKTNVSWPLIHRSKPEEFSISTDLETAVACLRIFPGIMPEMVEGILQLKGLRGLVLETFGAGNAPEGPDNQMTKAIGAAIERGIVVVNITQCISGSVRQAYASASQLGNIGVVFGHDMTSESALTKLCYLLGQKWLSVDEVRKQMAVSLRGELTDTSQTDFQHPALQFVQSDKAKLAGLGYAIACGDLDQVKYSLQGDQHHLLETPDYMGNTPVHLAACEPNSAILKYLLALGASVHLRNRDGRTALFMAASAQLEDNVALLTDAGAHLHTSEFVIARSNTIGNQKVWTRAGVLPVDERETLPI